MQKKKISVLFYVLFLVLMLCVAHCKIGFNIDEMLTYGLANSESSLGAVIQNGHKYEPASLPFEGYIKVVDGSRFDYGQVWYNQAEDVHPPLYYAILHTICSLRPNTFSKWYPIIINIVFQLLILCFIRKAVRIISKENELPVNIISVIYIMSSATLFITAFIRMYVMVTFFAVYAMYIIVDRAKGNDDKYFWIKLYMSAVCGALTHYYFIVYIVMLCAVYGVVLIVEKKYLCILKLILTGMASGISAICVFPSMISHIFFGYRGQQSFENVFLDFETKVKKLIKFFDMMNNDLFGGLFVIIIAITIILIVGVKNKKYIIDKQAIKMYTVIILPAAMYFVIISSVAVMNLNRYIYLVYPMLMIGVMGILCQTLQKFTSKKVLVCASTILTVFIVVSSHINASDNYLYRYDSVNYDFAKAHADVDSLYIKNDNTWELPCSAIEVSEYKSVIFVSYTDEDYLESTDFEHDEEIIVFIQGEDHSGLDDIMKKYPQFKNADRIGKIGYTTTYHLY